MRGLGTRASALERLAVTRAGDPLDLLVVGGGINSAQKAITALEAGADMIVIGNALEKEPDLLIEIADKVYELNKKVVK